MKLNDKLMTIPLILLAVSTAFANRSASLQDSEPPTFRVEVRGDLATEFTTRVSSYVELRSELENGLPAVTESDDPAEIRRAVLALASALRGARAGAKQGDIFTPAVSAELKRALGAEMNAATRAAITDDNPGDFSARINSSYPDGKPLSTVPPNVLAMLPRLPADIEYRFLGRDLILLDTKANMVIDRVADAIPGASRGTWWQRALGAMVGKLGRGVVPSPTVRPPER